MCDCANRTFFALRCYQSKLSPAIIKVFVHILKFSPAKKHKITFLLSYFSVTKSTKSQQGGLTPSSFRTSCGVHELVAQVMRGKCVRQWIKQKSAVLPLSAISYYHASEHSARKSRADSCTHCPTHIQIRATPSPVFSFFRILRLNRSCDLYDGNAGRSGNCTCCRICRKCCRRHCYLIR